MMINKVKLAINKHSMLCDDDKVVVALSGGADSVALLLSLIELGYSVSCVHVNHNLRGDESDRDEAFCVDLCSCLGVDLAVERVDVKAYCEANKLSLEEGARNLRYEAIEKHLNGARLATAHNLNDCFETTLFNLVRGTSLSGLMGIPPVRDNIIRPLILCTRDEIEAYLTAQGQSFVTDSTNLVPDCSRNMLRLEVIPKLMEINPGLYRSYSAFLQTAGESKAYLDEHIESEFNKNLEGNVLYLSNIPEGALRSGVLSLYLKNQEIMPTYDRISLILKNLEFGERINIQKGVYVDYFSGRITITRESEPNDPAPIYTDLRENLVFGTKRINITNISHQDISSLNKSDLKWCMDLNKVHGKVTVRSYIGNEKIKLLGRDITQTVKKLFASYAPSGERKNLVVIADDEGAIFAEGFGIADRVKCDSETNAGVCIDIL